MSRQLFIRYIQLSQLAQLDACLERTAKRAASGTFVAPLQASNTVVEALSKRLQFFRNHIVLLDKVIRILLCQIVKITLNDGCRSMPTAEYGTDLRT